MTKVLFITDRFPPENYGGAGVMAYHLATNKWGNSEVFVITSTQSSKAIAQEFKWGKVFRIPVRDLDYRRRFVYNVIMNPYAKQVFELVKEIQPDIVHCHNIHEFFSFKLLPKIKKQFTDIKLFYTSHDAMTINYGKLECIDPVNGTDNAHKLSILEIFKSSGWSYIPLRLFLIKKYLKSVDKVIVVSRALESYLNLNGVGKTKVIHNSIPEEKNDIEIPKQLKKMFSDRDKWIVFSGRTTKGKGIFRLLDALKGIKDAKLLIIGNKSEKIESHIEKLVLKDRVVFTGWVSNEIARKLLSYGSVCVIPTLTIDAFPTIMLEAALEKCPIIVTCFGGGKEFIRDGIDGYVVNPYEKNVLESKIMKILSDRDLGKKLGESAYERFLSDFSMTAFIKEHEKLYFE